MLVAQPNFDTSFTCALIMKNDQSEKSFNYIDNNLNIVDFFHKYFADIVELMPNLIAEYKDNPTGSLKYNFRHQVDI